MKLEQVDTRFRKRIACDLNLNGKSYPGIVLNLSRGGMFVQTSLGARPGTSVNVDLKAPSFQNPIALQAEVVWKRVVPRRQGLGHGGVGLVIHGSELTYEGLLRDIASTSEEGGATSSASQAAEPCATAAASVPATSSYRVRLRLEGSPRSRTIAVDAQSAEDAARVAAADCGENWSVLEVETPDA